STRAPDIHRADQLRGTVSTTDGYPFRSSSKISAGDACNARIEVLPDCRRSANPLAEVRLSFSHRNGLLLPPMPTHMETVLRAAAFAAEKHRTQRRKDVEASPYINHPIQLAYILVQADIEDPEVLAAALLHDTIEDTQTTLDELEIVFGYEIANIVAECSDDKR